jgi:hypothetical protein
MLITNTNTTTATDNNAFGNPIRCLFVGVLAKMPQKTWGRFLYT